MPTRKLSSYWCPKQWRKCVFTASSQWSKILAGIEWYFHRGLLYLGRSRGTGNFTAWAKNQPNNFRDEDCVHTLGVEYKYEWNDVKCSDCHQYTCKKGKMWCISLGMHKKKDWVQAEWINGSIMKRMILLEIYISYHQIRWNGKNVLVRIFLWKW